MSKIKKALHRKISMDFLFFVGYLPQNLFSWELIGENKMDLSGQ
jgi:hypothetical protein